MHTIHSRSHFGSSVLEFLASPSESEDLDKMASDLALVGGASTVV